MAVRYEDHWINCDDSGIRVRWYYLWGSKWIAYQSIRKVERVELGLVHGSGRIWGTANPRYWASLDPGRPKKREAFVFDLGRHVRPFLTPEDPDRFAQVLTERTGMAPVARTGARPIL